MVTGKFVARDLKERLGIGSDSVRTNANADAWSANAPFTDEQHAHVEAEADLFYADFVQRVAEGRNMTVEAVDAVARGRVWTGADAMAHGLVDELGGLRTAIDRAKVLAGFDADAEVKLVGLPGSSLLDDAAAQAIVAAGGGLAAGRVGAVIGRSVAGLFGQVERSVSGVNALWLGEHRF